MQSEGCTSKEQPLPLSLYFFMDKQIHKSWSPDLCASHLTVEIPNMEFGTAEIINAKVWVG